MNWDDGKLFLAVARTGKMLTAAKTLGLNQATLSRRITAMEKTLGTQLLIRRTTGCELTDDGQSMVASLERIENEFLQSQANLHASDTSISGTVRIGAPDGFGVSFLAPRLGQLAARHPNLDIQLVPVPRTFSLSRREADIAIMVGRPEQGRLVAQKLTDYSLSLYASQSYLDTMPTPLSSGDLGQHRLIGYVDDLIYAPSLNYTDEFMRNWKSRIEISSAIGQLQAVLAGAGIAIMHDYLAAEHPTLKPVLPELQIQRAYWTVFHESLRDTARVRACVDFLSEVVKSSPSTFVRHSLPDRIG